MQNDIDYRANDLVVQAGPARLGASLAGPADADAVVLFVHGSGSSRFSSRNRFVAKILNDAGLATLLFDLLTAEEDEIDRSSREFRFDIPLLARRLVDAIDWTGEYGPTKRLRIGLFGASTGAAAALIAATERPDKVVTIVSRGGRPDLAGDALPRVRAPTLFIVGGNDDLVIQLNEDAAQLLTVEHRMEIIPGATHLFEEPGKLERVAQLASAWFQEHLRSRRSGARNVDA